MPTTPLHIACETGHIQITELLLRKGADPSVRNANGATALDLARARGHDDVAALVEP